MASQDIKGILNGAYSYQYQLLEQERYRRLREEQLESTRSVRDRTYQLSKQTIQRTKALEQKKLAMAKAEEERRRKALEERHKQQQEATNRFRSAIYRTNKSSLISPLAVKYHRTDDSKLANNGKKWTENHKRDRIILGHNVEINTPPNLDDVLENIRGRKSSNSFKVNENHKLLHEIESLSISPINLEDITPTNTEATPISTNEDTISTSTPLSNDVTSNENKFLFPVCQNAIEEKIPAKSLIEEPITVSSSSNESLHDSLDSPIIPSQISQDTPSQVISSPDILSQTISSPDTPSQIIQSPDTLLQAVSSPDTSSQSVTVTSQDISLVEIPSVEIHDLSQTDNIVEKKIVGILKKTLDGIDTDIQDSNISLTRASSKSSQVIKRVRFRDDTISSDTAGGTSNTPKMKISLTRKSKNGFVRVPQIYSNDNFMISNDTCEAKQLLTTSMDKTLLPSDEDISTLWNQISTYFYQAKYNDSTTPLTNKVYSTSQLSRSPKPHPQLKLWRRHALQQQSDNHSKSYHGSSGASYVNEEHRLLESIELLNERLKGRVVPMETTNYSDSNKRNRSEFPRPRVRQQTTKLQSTRNLQYR